MSSRASAMSTSRWMAPCCKPGHPMPRWRGPTASRIHHRRHQVLAKVSDSRTGRRSGPSVISAASSSATRPTAQGRIQTNCCDVNPRPIGILLAPTRGTTRRALSASGDASASRRMWPRTPPARATPNRSTPAGASRRCLAGSNSGSVCACPVSIRLMGGVNLVDR